METREDVTQLHTLLTILCDGPENNDGAYLQI